MTKFSVRCICYWWPWQWDSSILPIVWMASCFHIMEGIGSFDQVAASVWHQTTLIGRDRQVAAQGRSLPSSTASCLSCVVGWSELWYCLNTMQYLYTEPDRRGALFLLLVYLYKWLGLVLSIMSIHFTVLCIWALVCVTIVLMHIWEIDFDMDMMLFVPQFLSHRPIYKV